MKKLDSHLEIALASVRCFLDDGTLDEGELNYLLALALRDDHIDPEEKRVLGNILAKVSEKDVSAEVWRRIQEARLRYDV